ncbi:hypothetical protein JTE90_013188 [Oedothorax gibbosus]|uniref:Uncharacterized protein n=1 Tax=Oedothorax gibbosus TaxID=931172 RepID=A0AAV6TSR3_9ARAC|nr:hypothetical protein JTE90_013188 [Oedothorax gibbosus]
MSNSCYNPIVYYVMNSRFRGYFQEVMYMNSLCHKSSYTTGCGENGMPPPAKGSLITSKKTRSCRLSQLRSLKNRERNETPK